MAAGCAQVGCEKPARNRGLCWAHYCRIRRYGDPEFRRRSANGEGGLTGHGYRYASVGGRKKLEHRLVIEGQVGRTLLSDEVVHHIDGNKLNNAPENLSLLSGQGEHNVIEGRIKAFRESGDEQKKPCRFCHRYDDLSNLKRNGTSHYHKPCAAAYARRWRLSKKG